LGEAAALVQYSGSKVIKENPKPQACMGSLPGWTLTGLNFLSASLPMCEYFLISLKNRRDQGLLRISIDPVLIAADKHRGTQSFLPTRSAEARVGRSIAAPTGRKQGKRSSPMAGHRSKSPKFALGPESRQPNAQAAGGTPLHVSRFFLAPCCRSVWWHPTSFCLF
jgi:hypothetical protein